MNMTAFSHKAQFSFFLYFVTKLDCLRSAAKKLRAIRNKHDLYIFVDMVFEF